MRAAIEQAAPGEDLIGIGLDLAPHTLLPAYSAGLFPMGVGRNGARPIGWWSPDPRGILPIDGMRVTRSLRRSAKRFEIRVDTAFDDVVAACAAPDRDGRWITPSVRRAYSRLWRAGYAHSVECWLDGYLAGGLYGVGLGGLFAGESMFHRVRDASKVALLALVNLLADGGGRLLDVQWRTEHLSSLGVIEIPRTEYLRLLDEAVPAPPVPFMAGCRATADLN
ncbi:MAG: leucyl/phenylalanyl-tRNA--protein transferase [Micrococcales bacterium]|nr:MAG: leucyl/phenylalanyl-tRNA--protein transferase [Micrococcales bacterium]